MNFRERVLKERKEDDEFQWFFRIGDTEYGLWLEDDNAWTLYLLNPPYTVIDGYETLEDAIAFIESMGTPVFI